MDFNLQQAWEWNASSLGHTITPDAEAHLPASKGAPGQSVLESSFPDFQTVVDSQDAILTQDAYQSFATVAQYGGSFLERWPPYAEQLPAELSEYRHPIDLAFIDKGFRSLGYGPHA